MEESSFLYSVSPKKPIKGILENGRPINSSKSLQLTLEQVQKCMACGSVYRWFANEDKLERVTSLNMERLHNEKFMTEEEFAEFKLNGVAGNAGKVVDVVEEPAPVVEEAKVEEEVAAPAADETPVEEVKVEEATAVEEEKVEEVAPVEEVVEEVPATEEVSVDGEPVVEYETNDGEPIAEEAPKAEFNNSQSNNYKKKKH